MSPTPGASRYNTAFTCPVYTLETPKSVNNTIMRLFRVSGPPLYLASRLHKSAGDVGAFWVEFPISAPAA
jgi:hypothetical protein